MSIVDKSMKKKKKKEHKKKIKKEDVSSSSSSSIKSPYSISLVKRNTYAQTFIATEKHGGYPVTTVTVFFYIQLSTSFCWKTQITTSSILVLIIFLRALNYLLTKNSTLIIFLRENNKTSSNLRISCFDIVMLFTLFIEIQLITSVFFFFFKINGKTKRREVKKRKTWTGESQSVDQGT